MNGAAYGLDFGAVLVMAEAMGALSPLLVDVLPVIETILVSAYRQEPDHGDA